MSQSPGQPSRKLRSVSVLPRVSESCARIIAISSGKGGVGKSSISLNLAVELSRLKYRVCIFDADTNLANINIMTGATPHYTIQDMLEGRQSMQDILLKGPAGIRIVPAASGIMEFVSYDLSQQNRLIDSIRQLEQQFDFILIDTAAGISESVLSFVQAASETIIAITSEPTSLTDAFSLLKVLKRKGFDQPFQVLVNKVQNYQQAKEVLARFSAALKKYLGLRIIAPGYVLEDRNVPRSVMLQRPYAIIYPDSPASHCLRNFAQRVIERKNQSGSKISSYLMERLSRVEPHAEGLTSAADIDDLLETIHSAPFEEVEQLIATINRHWLERIEQQESGAEYRESDGFRAAMRFASKLKL